MAFDYDTLTLIYLGIGVFAYFSILFLTFRDMRIFRRTGYISYRKGAFKGIIASSLVLVGLFLIPTMNLLGLALVFLGVMVNQKGAREKVFTTANTLNRFIGQTDIVLTNEEKKALYEQQVAEKKQMEKEKEKNERREKIKEQREEKEEE
ncbi:hypothetical protein MmiEs2_12090 [Methanimicrococcus stummii]|uniref:Uncharacterized protein n=1 Tax=Methanimicrococcus stummii TaxID=3028294 RepID=A0AA96VIK7_9EURY|nr:hypothetical protein [Methanimicrococcus sp. Es2]WNY28996.1 hypothetical protein MmiEs2_12090 [Methanimicrococcus sp. Es2]